MFDDRDVEVMQETAEFVAELRRLADALESGEAYSIKIEGEEITIPADAVFSIAHEAEDGDSELEFQIFWSAVSDETADDEETASDEEPESV